MVVASIKGRRDQYRMPGAPVFLLVVVIIAVTVLYGLQVLVRYQRRVMIHQERMAAIEKGMELPPLEQEIQRSGWNVQRLLLLAGLSWVSVGIAVFPLLNRLAGQTLTVPWGYDQSGPVWARVPVPSGLEWIGVALIGIGVSHLVTFAVGRQREREESRRP
jgi:hypothetical protein